MWTTSIDFRYKSAKKKKNNAGIRCLVISMSDKLFDIKSSKAKFRCKKDELFYEDQKHTRQFKMGSIDRQDCM